MKDGINHPDIPYREPETQEDAHRPNGVPRPREIKSQQAQLHSTHQHGTDKSQKTKMSKKIGLED